jgi:hypothetical protein
MVGAEHVVSGTIEEANAIFAIFAIFAITAMVALMAAAAGIATATLVGGRRPGPVAR